jgi:hypothetical protein
MNLNLFILLAEYCIPVLGFNGVDYQYSRLIECGSLYPCRKFPVLRRNVLPEQRFLRKTVQFLPMWRHILYQELSNFIRLPRRVSFSNPVCSCTHSSSSRNCRVRHLFIHQATQDEWLKDNFVRCIAWPLHTHEIVSVLRTTLSFSWNNDKR